MKPIEIELTDFDPIAGVLEWVKENDWAETFNEFVAEFRETFEQLTEDVPEIDLDILPGALVKRVVGACFEQFLTLAFESTPSNALDQYLEEVGPDLSSETVDFLVPFRHSSISLYEVVDRVRGGQIVLKEVYRKTPKFSVADQPSAMLWKYRDTVAARIIMVNGQPTLAGAGLVIPREFREQIRSSLEDIERELSPELPKQALGRWNKKDNAPDLTAPHAALLIISVWLIGIFAVLEDYDRDFAVDPDEEDGPFLQATFRLWIPIQDVFAKLEAIPELIRPPFSEPIWYLYDDVDEDEEAGLLVIVWLSDDHLIVDGLSRAGVMGSVDRLSELFGDGIGEPTIVEHAVPEDDEEERLTPIQLPDEEDAAFRERMRSYLDETYREMLDEPVEELRGRTPRELTKTAKGRKELVKWIVKLEESLRAAPEDAGMAGYDFDWMWKELGIESLRQGRLFE